MKIAIGTVHGEDINSWYFHSILGLAMHIRRNAADVDAVEHIDQSDWCMVRSGPALAMGRGRLIGSFLESTDADALLVLDADMVFTPATIVEMVNTFTNMVATYDNVGMLGGLAFICNNPRGEQPMPNLWTIDTQTGSYIQQHGYAPDTLYEVAATGGACVIMTREVCEKLTATTNPFHHVSLINWHMLARDLARMDDLAEIEAKLKDHVLNSDQLGEDLSFCYRLREAGYRIFVHTGLRFDHAKSNLIGEPEFLRAIEQSMVEQATVLPAGPIPAPPNAQEATV